MRRVQQEAKPQEWKATGFVHPGVFVSRAQLDFVKSAIANKRRTRMYIAFQQAVASKWGKLDYVAQGPPATGIIECGSYDKPDIGCHRQDDDAMAAYVQSLLWYITGDQQLRQTMQLQF